MALLVGVSAMAQDSEVERRQVIEALRQSKVIHPERVLVHISHTCEAMAGRVRLQVFDVREILPGASSPRGVNHIVVFGPEWRLVHDIGYVNQRPLFCRGNQLVLFGRLAIRNELPDGNTLEFQDGGQRIIVRQTDMNALPSFGKTGGFPK